MTPFHPAFRRLLRHFIPQLKNDDLNRHESLTALRLHLLLKRDMQPPVSGIRKIPISRRGIDDDIAAAANEANAILAPYKREYEAGVRLWIARRELVQQQGRFFQIPLNWRDAKLLTWAIVNYWNVNRKALPILLRNRVKYFWRNVSIVQVILIITLVALSCYGVCSEAKLPSPDLLK